MNLTNSMIILFHNFFFRFYMLRQLVVRIGTKSCFLDVYSKISQYVYILFFLHFITPHVHVQFSIISFRICPTAYIIDIKKVNISHLQCIEVGGNISLMTNNQQQLGFVCIFSFFWYIKIPMEDGSSNLSADSVLVFKVIGRDSHFLFSVILFIKS